MSASRFSRTQMRNWLTEYMAELLGLPPREINPAESFESYGLDSTGAVGLSGDLEDLLGASFDTTLAYEYESIDALVEHLVARQLVDEDGIR
jgi:acyl carrier protein